MNSINIPSRGVVQPLPITDYLQSPAVNMRPTAANGKSFKSVLTEALATVQESPVTLSNHAKNRLESRGIQLDSNDMNRLGKAIDMAKLKGAHDSLVLMDGNAFIVNVDQRTVVTALNAVPNQGGLFTNIDSAVVM
jgi:flagellar operon protein